MFTHLRIMHIITDSLFSGEEYIPGLPPCHTGNHQG